jgi:hypothetical protein
MPKLINPKTGHRRDCGCEKCQLRMMAMYLLAPCLKRKLPTFDPADHIDMEAPWPDEISTEEKGQ